eukprot:TRINITY_DN4500_c1_g1_i2.p1 TRINITY_DN4500_c1_g1~~TRINITY_DN4500_c1_g1_i2.p1  ORF type:complete len:139 (-),score=7.85 TRINITY_DN4500_c1_g1_i2:294-710(-)
MSAAIDCGQSLEVGDVGHMSHTPTHILSLSLSLSLFSLSLSVSHIHSLALPHRISVHIDTYRRPGPQLTKQPSAVKLQTIISELRKSWKAKVGPRKYSSIMHGKPCIRLSSLSLSLFLSCLDPLPTVYRHRETRHPTP